MTTEEQGFNEGVDERLRMLKDASVSKDDKLRTHLSHGAAQLLDFISNKQEPVHVSELDSKYDEYLTELYGLRLIRLSKVYQGRVEPTEAGLDAVDKRVAIRYPMGKNGTITDYFNTLVTMTVSAKNAFIKQLSRVGTSFFQDVHRGQLGDLFNMFCDLNIFPRVPPPVNRKMHGLLNKCLEYYTSKEPATMAAETIEEQLLTWDAILNSKIRSQIENLGVVKLPEKVIFRDDFAITEIKYNDGNVQVVYDNPYVEGGKQTDSVEKLLPEVKISLLRQLGP